MKKSVALLSSLLLSFFLSSCATPPPLLQSDQPERDLAIAQNTFDWLNAHRAKEGAKTLNRVSALDRLARKTASQIGSDPLATVRNATLGSCAYARQVLKYDSIGLSFKGDIATQKEPGLSALNFWSNSKYSSDRIVQPFTSVGIGSFTKSDGQTILSVILGNRFTYDPATWNKLPRNL